VATYLPTREHENAHQTPTPDAPETAMHEDVLAIFASLSNEGRAALAKLLQPTEESGQ
jgi:hypothetical protein